MALTWRPGDEFVQFILSFHLYIGSRDQIQVINLGVTCPWSLNYPTGCVPQPFSPSSSHECPWNFPEAMWLVPLQETRHARFHCDEMQFGLPLSKTVR